METLPLTDPSSEPSTPPAPTEEARPSIRWQKFLLDLLETLVMAIVLYIGINAVSARVRVDGWSMAPTLEDGEFVLVSRLAYRLDQPQRGDIIVFKYPAQPDQDLIKRIIGLPGDVVEVKNAGVFVNGQPLEEPYIADKPAYQGLWWVPAGHLFVLGDNRNESSDSHSWGLLPIENVIGKAVLVYWPIQEWKVLKPP